jgi:APA family basic amino acid/polyamine antiporter
VAETTDPDPGPARLRRVLGPVEVTASGVGIIIGAGIYVLLGAATAEAGNAVWLSFLIAAGLCGLTGLSYAELASMFPSAGAEYDYTRRVFPARWAFLVGWTMTVGLMVAAAAIAVGFAHYLEYFVDVPLVAAAVALLAFDAAVALTGIGRSARLTLALSALQVAGLIFVIVIGASHVGDRSVLSDVNPSAVLGGAALVFFAFIGFDEVITLAEETRDPTRVIPRALFAALGISALLYMAVAITAVSVIGAPALAESNRPLADVMAHVLGGNAEGAVAAIALVTTTNTSLLALTAASRLTYGMADAGALPASARRVSRRTGAPTAGIVIAAVGAAAFALIGDLTFVASVTDFAVYAVFLAVNAAVIVLRRTAPDAARPFRIPGSIHGVPVIPIVGSIAALAMIPQLQARSLWLGAALLVSGLLAHAALSPDRAVIRRDRRPHLAGGSRSARWPSAPSTAAIRRPSPTSSPPPCATRRRGGSPRCRPRASTPTATVSRPAAPTSRPCSDCRCGRTSCTLRCTRPPTKAPITTTAERPQGHTMRALDRFLLAPPTGFEPVPPP